MGDYSGKSGGTIRACFQPHSLIQQMCFVSPCGRSCCCSESHCEPVRDSKRTWIFIISCSNISLSYTFSILVATISPLSSGSHRCEFPRRGTTIHYFLTLGLHENHKLEPSHPRSSGAWTLMGASLDLPDS